jgi:hypothetical protein
MIMAGGGDHARAGRRRSDDDGDAARELRRRRLALELAAMEIVLTRPVIVGLAIAGALLALAASVLQAKGRVGPERARQLNLAGYVLMGLSMALFVWVGLRGAAA